MIDGNERLAIELLLASKKNIELRQGILTAIFRIEKIMPDNEVESNEIQRELKKLRRLL